MIQMYTSDEWSTSFVFLYKNSLNANYLQIAIDACENELEDQDVQLYKKILKNIIQIWI